VGRAEMTRSTRLFPYFGILPELIENCGHLILIRLPSSYKLFKMKPDELYQQYESKEEQLLDDERGSYPGEPTQDEKTLGLVAHLGTLAGGVVPFGNIVLPLVLWQTQKDKSQYVSVHAKEALSFQITMTLAYIVAAIMIFIVVGIFLLIGLAIFSLVVTIIAAIKASNGEYYKYPINYEFIN
jgi:uncharacterized Tic20 family protein